MKRVVYTYEVYVFGGDYSRLVAIFETLAAAQKFCGPSGYGDRHSIKCVRHVIEE